MNNPDVRDQDWFNENATERFVHEDQVDYNNPNLYNQDWPFEAILGFNKILIYECTVICQWVESKEHGKCNMQLQGKDLKTHLHTSHSIVSEWESYLCRWEGCHKAAMKKSSLERHVEEQHIPVRWACPSHDCGETFSRMCTLQDHVLRSPGHPPAIRPPASDKANFHTFQIIKF